MDDKMLRFLGTTYLMLHGNSMNTATGPRLESQEGSSEEIVDELLRQASTEQDPQKLTELLREINLRLAARHKGADE